MKRCPECGRDYNDDSLSFCLDDGSELLFGPGSMNEARTAISHDVALPSEARTRAQLHVHDTEETAILPSGVIAIPKAKGFDKRLLLAGLVVVVIALGGFFGYRYFANGAKQINSLAVMPIVNERGNPDV